MRECETRNAKLVERVVDDQLLGSPGIDNSRSQLDRSGRIPGMNAARTSEANAVARGGSALLGQACGYLVEPT